MKLRLTNLAYLDPARDDQTIGCSWLEWQLIVVWYLGDGISDIASVKCLNEILSRKTAVMLYQHLLSFRQTGKFFFENWLKRFSFQSPLFYCSGVSFAFSWNCLVTVVFWTTSNLLFVNLWCYDAVNTYIFDVKFHSFNAGIIIVLSVAFPFSAFWKPRPASVAVFPIRLQHSELCCHNSIICFWCHSSL